MIWRKMWPRQARLPETVFVELVDMLYAAAFPVAFIGVALAVVGGFATSMIHDPVISWLTGCGVAVTLVRLSVIVLYRRRRNAAMDAARSRRWELAYAGGTMAFALCVGCLGARILMVAPAPVQIMSALLMFGYCAGQVSRISIRPEICIPTLLLAAVPVIVAYVARGGVDDMAIAVFVTLFLVASFETVAFGASTAVALVTSKQQLAALARHDHLTGLPNRMVLWDSIDAAVLGVGGAGGLAAVHCLDLDGFKAVNDQYGHAMGDALLKAAAARLQASIRPGDVALRLGGDEFVIVQAGLVHAMDAEMLARRIIRALNDPFTIEGNEVRIGVSVGIALAPKDGARIEDLMERADQALYVAKRQGRNRFKFVDGRDQATSSDALVAAWRRA